MSKRGKRTQARISHPRHTPGGRASKQPPKRKPVRTDLPRLDEEGAASPDASARPQVAATGDKGFKVLALVGHKGGSGKTTAAVSIATELCERGERVLLVDTDPQGSTSQWSGLGAASARGLPTVVSMGPGLQRRGQLPRLAEAFDHVLVDCPPRRSDLILAVLHVADLAVLPCGPSAPDIWALSDSVEVVREMQRTRPELRGRVLLTRKVVGTAIVQTARDAIAECGLPTLSVELGYRVAYQEAMGRGLGVCQIGSRSTAAAEVRALVGELLALPVS